MNIFLLFQTNCCKSSVKVTIPLPGRMKKTGSKTQAYKNLRMYVEAIDYIVHQNLDDASLNKNRTESWNLLGNYATSLQCEMYTELRQNNKTVPRLTKLREKKLKDLFKDNQKSHVPVVDFKILEKFKKFLTSIHDKTVNCPQKNKKANKQRRNNNKKKQKNQKKKAVS